MKIALLADIHANAEALAAVLAKARSEGIYRLLIAGDSVGYYYGSHHVFRLLNDWDWTMVRGNHEDMLSDWLSGHAREEIRSRYGSGIEEAAQCLASSQLDDLVALPQMRELEIDGRRILLCHGSPWDGDAYIYPDAPREVQLRMMAGGHDLVVFGHTHYPVLWDFGAAKAVNPGSVGQQRDRQPGACWAVWDVDTNTVTLRREPYDPSKLVAECRRRDPHLPYLADVLGRN